VLVLAIAVGCGAPAEAGKLEERENYWRDSLRSELPPGTSLDQAKQFFAKSGLEHSFDAPSHTISAIERDVAQNFPVSWSITIQCKFDASERVERCESKKVGTGP